MPREILVKPEAGQEVVVNPVGGLKIAKINRSKTRLQARVTVEGVYVEPVEPPPVEPPPVEPPPVEPPPPTGGFPPETTLTYIAHPNQMLPPLRVPVATSLGTKLTRITDNGVRHAYSRIQPWNIDGSLLLMAYGAQILDGNTYAPIKQLGTLPGYAQWSVTDPNVLYGTWDSETKLFALNVQTGAISTAKDFGRRVSLGKGEGAISDTGRIALQTLDAPWLVYVWDTKTGQFSSFPVPINSDNVTMSHDGNHVVVFYDPTGAGTGKGIWAYNADGSNGRQLSEIARHGDPAIDQSGRQVWVQCSPSAFMVDIITGAKTDLLGTNAFVNGHVSGRGRTGWAYFSDYQGSGTAPGTDQVVAVKLDGSQKVQVFAFANRKASGYESQPQATVSRDGKRVLFASDYGTNGYYAFVGEA